MKTLIIEDNSTVRQVLEEQIHAYGYEVTAKLANSSAAIYHDSGSGERAIHKDRMSRRVTARALRFSGI